MKSNYFARNMVLTLLAVVGLLVTGRALPVRAADVSAANLADKVASAATQADHDALAAYFREVAEVNAKQVAEHEAMLDRVIAAGGKPSITWQRHCKSLIAAYGSAKDEAAALAQEHEQLAKEAAK